MILPYDERRLIYEEAIAQYGKENQQRMAIEEMSELTKELCKFNRHKGNVNALVDEIADVAVMMEQLCIMFNIKYAVEDMMSYKVRRLRTRMNQEGGAS